jgi:hypothetical protein
VKPSELDAQHVVYPILKIVKSDFWPYTLGTP